VNHVVACPRRSCASGIANGGRFLVACAVSAALSAPLPPAFAQSLNPYVVIADTPQPAALPNKQLLLEADQLIYDFDGRTVTAKGNVRIYYDGYVLDADSVIYNQASGRLVATGGVRMLEPGGNIVTTDRLDITDDFRDAFVSSLNVVTIDEARFSAQTAERRDANLTIFHRGVYTACKPCLEHPERPPLWQIKAARIIHDQSEHTIYYENARLEFFGIPIAYVPFFFHPDPTVKRKTGFLAPSILQSDSIGFGVTTPFFWNLAPNYDVTFSPTILSRQGLLMQGQWRHRLLNGAYSIRAAGIFQQDPGVFTDAGASLSGESIDNALIGATVRQETQWRQTFQRVNNAHAAGGSYDQVTHMTDPDSRPSFAVTGVGVGVDIFATKSATSGKARIYVDGLLEATINLHAAASHFNVDVYSTTFAFGPHTVRVEAVGTATGAASSVGLDVVQFTAT